MLSAGGGYVAEFALPDGPTMRIWRKSPGELIKEAYYHIIDYFFWTEGQYFFDPSKFSYFEQAALQCLFRNSTKPKVVDGAFQRRHTPFLDSDDS